MYLYFSEQELKCHCGCGEQLMDEDFMFKLEQIREDLDFPFILTSAYRCSAYNERVSSTGPDGPHTTGRAVDIAASGIGKYRIMNAAIKAGMTRVGIGKSFIHIDDLTTDDGYPDKVIWSY